MEEINHIKNLDISSQGRLLHSKIENLDSADVDSISPADLIENGYDVLNPHKYENDHKRKNDITRSLLLEICRASKREKPKVILSMVSQLQCADIVVQAIVAISVHETI